MNFFDEFIDEFQYDLTFCILYFLGYPVTE